MNATQTCPRCKAQLPAGSAPGLCSSCQSQAGDSSVASQRSTIVIGEVTRAVAFAEAAAAVSGPQPGSRFGGYDIVRQLGQGGMGTVFEAEQVETGRRVALKVLNHALDLPEARKRFLREGRLA